MVTLVNVLMRGCIVPSCERPNFRAQHQDRAAAARETAVPDFVFSLLGSYPSAQESSWTPPTLGFVLQHLGFSIPQTRLLHFRSADNVCWRSAAPRGE
jgi:hypothetical protein